MVSRALASSMSVWPIVVMKARNSFLPRTRWPNSRNVVSLLELFLGLFLELFLELFSKLLFLRLIRAPSSRALYLLLDLLLLLLLLDLLLLLFNLLLLLALLLLLDLLLLRTSSSTEPASLCAAERSADKRAPCLASAWIVACSNLIGSPSSSRSEARRTSLPVRPTPAPAETE